MDSAIGNVFVDDALSMIKAKMDSIKQFWSKIDKKSDDECWNWIAAQCSKHSKYGRFRINSKSWLAHRFSWTLTFGDIPEGLLVCHICDNPLCCNPKHLFLGTDADNMKDRDNKGRTAKGMRITNAKLSWEQVCEIRSKYVPRKITTPKLAREYGVSQMQIWYIVNNVWRKCE